MFNTVMNALKEERWKQTLSVWENDMQSRFDKQLKYWSENMNRHLETKTWKPDEIYFVDFKNAEGVSEKVYEELRDIWMNNDLSNDDYIYKWDKDDVDKYVNIAQFLVDNEMTDRPVVIHWWW